MSVFIRRWHLYCQNTEQAPEQLIQDNINGMVGRKDEHTLRQHFSLNDVKKEMGGWNPYSMSWTWSRPAAEPLCALLGLGIDTRAGTSITYPEPVPVWFMCCEMPKAMCWERGCDDWVGPSCSFSAWGISDCTWSKSQPKSINSEFKHRKMEIIISISTETHSARKLSLKILNEILFEKHIALHYSFISLSLSFMNFHS